MRRGPLSGAELRRYWEEHKTPLDPFTGMPRMAGGAYPTAPAQSPGPELQEMELPEWEELTQRIELPATRQKFEGLNNTQTLTLERVGCPAEVSIRVIFKWETPAAAEATPSLGMPWAVLKELRMKANGVSGIIDCSGLVLESRQKVVFLTPEHAILKNTNAKPAKIAAKTAVEWEWIIQVPIAEDLKELEGIVLAQSEETALSFDLTWASEAELLSEGKPEKVEGTIDWMVTLFSIGTMVVNGKKVVVLPDLRTLHGLTERKAAISAEGAEEAPLTRTSGDLLRYFVTAWKKAKVTQYAPETWTEFTFKFGGNQEPAVWKVPAFLVERNARDYRGRPDVEGVHFLILDTTLDDAIRDAIRPMLLSEVKSIIGIPSAPETGAFIGTAQETLYPAEA